MARYEKRDESCWYDTLTQTFLAERPLVGSPGDLDEAPWLASLRRRAEAQLNAACRTHITSGYTSSALGAPYVYDSDLTDQVNIIGLLSDGVASIEYPCAGPNGRKVALTHTAAQLKAVKDGFVTRKAELLKQARIAKRAVGDATTRAEIAAALQDGLDAMAGVA